MADMLEYRQLRYFISVAENLNFTKASKQVHITQPALSQQIANIESNLGTKLFKRNRREVKLTKAGELLLAESREIIKRMENITDIVSQAEHGGVVEKLKIGYWGLYLNHCIIQIINNFKNKYPDVNLLLKQYKFDSLIEAVQCDDVDLCFTCHFKSDTLMGIDWKKISTDKLVVALPPNHPSCEGQTWKEILDDAEKSDTPVYLLENEPRGLNNINRILFVNGCTPNIHLVDCSETALLYVKTGMGITIVPRQEILKFGDSLSYSIIDSEYAKIDLVIAYKKNNQFAAIERLLKVAAEIKSDDQ